MELKEKIKTTIKDAFCVTKMPYFITIKPPFGSNPKYSRISYWYDQLRKVSSTFLITREKNKTFEGYHFHAVARLNKLPSKQWYKKGFHYFLTKVGSSKKVKKNSHHIHEEILHEEFPHSEERLVALMPKILDFEERQNIEENRKKKQIDGVLNYILKENTGLPYEDYIIIIRNKVRI